MSVVEQVVRGLLVAAGLLLPGAGWALAARLPLPWFAAGVISALSLFAGVVGLAWAGLPISVVSLAVWLGLVGAGGGWFWFRIRPRREATPTAARRELWWVLPILPMLFVAIWRAVAQPLPGADADFRWDRLARMLVETGGLQAYPPVSPEAFAQYFWADGIAPLTSGIYAWTYLAAGSTTKTWTAIPVLLQTVGLLALLQALARLWTPTPRAGWFACGLAGATMLLQFSFGLGQETGLTALGAGGMAYYLALWRRRGEFRLLIPAALCAALAACAREYGALFLVVAAGYVVCSGGRWRELAAFVGLAALWPACWHLRVWHLTGNPLYAHDVAGWFPINPVFSAWMRGYVETYGAVFKSVSGWREITRLFLISSVPAGFGLVAGLILWRRERGFMAGFGLVVAAAAAWIASVPFTAGGLFYSMRVLSPLLLIACAWGGAALGRWVSGRQHLAGVVLGLALWGGDAALRALTIPLNPYATAPTEWLQAGYRLQQDFAREDEPFIEAVARRVPGRVLSESAGVQHVFLRQGKVLAPLWSPEVSFLFAPDFQGDAADRLIALGYSHVLLTRVQSSVDFLERSGALRRLEGRMKPVAANGTFILLALQPATAPP